MGKLIVLDGTDGVGKTTQTALLVNSLVKEGLAVETISFPGYEKTVSGQMITRYLRGELGDVDNTDPYLVSYLYATDRFESKKELSEKLQTSDIVIATRYAVSNLAYQAAKLPIERRKQFRKWCLELDYKVYNNPVEDGVIFLSMPPDFSSKLLAKRKAGSKEKDIHEDDIEYMMDVWQEYLLFCREHAHCHKIDCVKEQSIRSIEEIAEEIEQITQKILIS